MTIPAITLFVFLVVPTTVFAESDPQSPKADPSPVESPVDSESLRRGIADEKALVQLEQELEAIRKARREYRPEPEKEKAWWQYTGLMAAIIGAFATIFGTVATFCTNRRKIRVEEIAKSRALELEKAKNEHLQKIEAEQNKHRIALENATHTHASSLETTKHEHSALMEQRRYDHDTSVAKASQEHQANLANIAQRHNMTKDFLKLALDPGSDPETRQKVLRYLRLRTGDPEMQKWAEEELQQVEPMVKEMARLRNEIAELRASQATDSAESTTTTSEGGGSVPSNSESSRIDARLAAAIAKLSVLRRPDWIQQTTSVMVKCPNCGEEVVAESLGSNKGDTAWPTCQFCSARFPIHRRGDGTVFVSKNAIEFPSRSLGSQGLPAEAVVLEWFRANEHWTKMKVAALIPESENDPGMDFALHPVDCPDSKAVRVQVLDSDHLLTKHRIAQLYAEKLQSDKKTLLVLAVRNRSEAQALSTSIMDAGRPPDGNVGTLLFDVPSERPAGIISELIQWLSASE